MKLKATIQQFSLVLERHASIPGGESKLFISIIRQAYTDILQYSNNGQPRKVDSEAVRFFFDGRMDVFADFIGINPEFVREMLCKSAPGIEAYAKP